MHFWINKGSQGCGLNGRYVPSSISAGTRRNLLCGGLHPKPMVTPVHRFQSIESVASGLHRHSRAPPFHTRFPVPQQQHHNSNGASIECAGSSGPRHGGHNQRARQVSLEFSVAENNSATPTNRASVCTKLKCGVWALIAIVPFSLFFGKYFFKRENVDGAVAFVCAILILILLIGAFLSLFDEFGTKGQRRESVQIPSEHNESLEDTVQHVPRCNVILPPSHTELPPPPYHVAVMLPVQPNHNKIQDSPPPTYEKAVT